MGYLLDERTQRPRKLVHGDQQLIRVDQCAPFGLSTYRDMPAFGLLQHAAEQVPDRTAIIYGDRNWNYADLNSDSIRAAATLQRLGVQPGDRVGILLPNVPEYIIAANAIWRAGGVAIAISPLMVAEEVQALLKKTDCRSVVCLDMLSHLVGAGDDSNVRSLLVSIRQHLPSLHQIGYLWARHSRTGHWTLPTTNRCQWFWEEIDKTDQSWQPISIKPDSDAAYILPTGGTTGSPKAVTLSHTNMVANAWQQYQWSGGSFATETMLAVLPFFHTYGMSATIMGGAVMGATLVLHHRFNTRQVIRLMEDQKPTVFHAVPAMLIAMNKRFRSHPPNIEGLRWVISGGAPLEEAVGNEFADHTGALVVEGFGLSEASPVTHVGHLFKEARYGTIGLPLPETHCRIVNANDSDLVMDDGEVGELLVRGPQVMLGYWKEPRATREAIQRGWLHTGDLAVKDPDGYYRIVGRKKDLIITSGFNVYPCEVEAVLREAEGVLDAAVVGQPDASRGEIVKAFIVLRPNVQWDEEQLREHCTAHLAKYKQPRSFEVCKDLPRNFLGKVIRRELRETTDETATDSATNAETTNAETTNVADESVEVK
jgi:long-chain acyl-CoA synthetase